MYHAISPPPAGAALPGLFVPESEFEAQMKWLADNGYHGVTLGQVFDAWQQGEPIAEAARRDLLRRRLSEPVRGRPADARQARLARRAQPRDRPPRAGRAHRRPGPAAVDSGWELDSHTFTHPNLTEPGVDLDHEIADSRTELQERFDVPVDFFCYPAGEYDDTVVQAVKDAGYLGATTTHEGLASPDEPYELKRIRVEPGDGADGLAQKLGDEGA